MNPPPPLPQELIDLIIDFLHDDRLTLARCMLVCHRWLDRSRLHLFRDAYVTVPASEPFAMEQQEPEFKAHNLEAFIAFLERDASMSLRLAVHYLLIRGLYPRSNCILPLQRVSAVLNLLPRLRSLSLLGVRLSSDVSFRNSLSTLSTFHSLDRLSMSDVTASPRGSTNKRPILDLFSLFTSINTLFVNDFYAGRTDTDPLDDLSEKVHVAALQAIRLRDFDLLQAIFSRAIRLDGVTSFTCTITQTEHILSARSLLFALCSDTLTHLEFDLRWFEHEHEEVWERMNLTLLKSLRTFRLHLALSTRQELDVSIWTSTIALLSRFSNLELTHLVLHIYVGPCLSNEQDQLQVTPASAPSQRLQLLDWERFIRLIDAMSTLRSVTFHVAFQIDFDSPDLLARRLGQEDYRQIDNLIKSKLDDGGRGRRVQSSWQQCTWETLEA
ncbi:unnamed protein product [Somion occarium]|uniref:F-box domain-containing protein n=1 Tax=Somion occarium TaxID=3059160 RepID=A0ABP1E8Z4_9APHY